MNPMERAIERSATAINEADRLAGLNPSYQEETTMEKFKPGDYVIVDQSVRFRGGQRARVLGPTTKYGHPGERLEGCWNITFEDNKPYIFMHEDELELADA